MSVSRARGSETASGCGGRHVRAPARADVTGFVPVDAGDRRPYRPITTEVAVTDVIELIKHDHREVEDLFAKFSTTHDASVAEQICDELDRHAAAEEKAVYPVFGAEVPGAEPLVEEGAEEHAEARQLIGRIRQTKDAEHLDELVTELQKAIEHHVSEEESELLPKASSALDAGRLDELGADFEAAKA
jgi:hemerythrin superfamily protein